MPVWPSSRVFALALSALLTATPLSAQSIGGRAAEITFGGRLHGQFSTSSVEGADANFFIRRARFTIDARIGERLDARVMPDFAGGGASLQDAYVRYRLTPSVRVSVGQFKRAFDLFELESSTRLPVIERDGRIPGFGGCPGVGRVCSYSRLTERLRFAGRDVGVKLDGPLGESGTFMVTLTNGTGVNTSDENGGKSISGRVAFDVADDIVIGANVGVHDWVFEQPTPALESTEYALAGGADVMVGRYGGGPLLMASVVFGDNWEILDPSGDEQGFVAAQVIGSYYHELVSTDALHGIEPVLRLSYGDPNRDGADDGALLLTPGVHVYFSGRNRFGVNLDVYSPETGDTEFSFKAMTYVYF